jgi:hypoxanthine phosphoribosyltransferase
MCVALQIPLIHVRKNGEDCHGAEIEGTAWNGVRKYLIVDDFIDRGTTVEQIYERILHKAEREKMIPPECAGIYLYEESGRRTVYEIDKGFKVPVYC